MTPKSADFRTRAILRGSLRNAVSQPLPGFRAKDMAVSGGENTEPTEIESARSVHPAVSQVAVIGAYWKGKSHAVSRKVFPVFNGDLAIYNDRHNGGL